MKKTIILSLLGFSLLGGAQASDLMMETFATTPSSPYLKGYKTWMSTEVNDAWVGKYKGTGAKIFVVDDHAGRHGFSMGNLNEGLTSVSGSHGYWTALESKLVSPSASIAKVDWNMTIKFNKSGVWSNNPIKPLSGKLNVINASFGSYISPSSDANNVNFGYVLNEVKRVTNSNSVLLSKAAGNDGVDMGATVSNRGGNVDGFAKAVKNSNSVLFVGALDKNGTVDNQASITSYSNRASSDAGFNSKYLMVGVETSKTGLAGTSFAAPIISSYAAIVNSKFKTANPTQVANQLLNTARTDTIKDYNVNVHGRGEASLTRALAPVSLQ
jgi:Subtilase family